MLLMQGFFVYNNGIMRTQTRKVYFLNNCNAFADYPCMLDYIADNKLIMTSQLTYAFIFLIYIENIATLGILHKCGIYLYLLKAL